MAFTPVPWFLDGGVQHDATVFRTLAYAIFGGQEGILSSTDFLATQGDVPGPFVNLAAGVGAVLNRQPGGFSQMYVGRADSQTAVDIAATDSSGPRSDMIVGIIKDPLDGSGLWSPPADRANGPYFEPMVIAGVPPTARKLSDLTGIGVYNAIPLWRVDVPASTATITTDMFAANDLRVVANTMTGIGGGAEKMWTAAATDTGSTFNKAMTNWTNFPSVANWELPIPAWATNCDISVRAVNLKLATAGSIGGVRTNIGGNFGYPASQFDFDFNPAHSGDTVRQTIEVGGWHSIPATMRGTTQSLKLEVQSRAGFPNDGGTLTADANSFVYAAINFKQKPGTT